MSKIKVLYSKKLPIPGNRFANETFQAEIEVEIFRLDPVEQFAIAFADVRAAVEIEFSERRSEVKAAPITEPEPEPPEDKNLPGWMEEGEPSDDAIQESVWAKDYGDKYEDIPDNLEPPTVKQIGFIENLMHDKIVPNHDEKALEYFGMLKNGFMDKETAKKCINYLKKFDWKPSHKQRGYDLQKGEKK